MTHDASFLTRLPANLLAAVDAAATQAGISRNQYVTDLLRQAAGGDYEPPMVVGWIAIDRPGEIEPWDCPECGQDMHEPHIGIISNGTFTAVVCGGCATND